MTPPAPIVDISIDFDFFVRELPEWDLTHNNSCPDPMLFKQMLWTVRYATHRLYEWTRMETYADFLPSALFERLIGDKGFRLGPQTGRSIGIADSHRLAFEFFHNLWKTTTPPDALINIDAHHDCYPSWSSEMVKGDRYCRTVEAIIGGQPLDIDTLHEAAPGLRCDNWLTYLFDHWQDHTHFVQLYPKWKALDVDKAPQRLLPMFHFNDWKGFGGANHSLQIRHIFVCRSPEWVPPHHDTRFLELLSACVQLGGKTRFLEKLPERIAPTEAEAESAWQAMHNLQYEVVKRTPFLQSLTQCTDMEETL